MESVLPQPPDRGAEILQKSEEETHEECSMLRQL